MTGQVLQIFLAHELKRTLPQFLGFACCSWYVHYVLISRVPGPGSSRKSFVANPNERELANLLTAVFGHSYIRVPTRLEFHIFTTLRAALESQHEKRDSVS